MSTTTTRFAASLLVALSLCLGSVEAGAQPYDPASIYWNTTTLIPMETQVNAMDPDDTRLRARVYEFLTIGTRDAGVEGLRVNVSGWLVGELTEPYDSESGDRFRGDLVYGNVSWRGLDGALGLKLGRQFIWLGSGSGVILDGLQVTSDLPADIEISAYGGWVAPPRFRYDESEHDRDYAAGARLAWAPWHAGHIALSYAHEWDRGDTARQNVGVDGSFTYIDWMELYGSALLDIVDGGLDEIRARADFEPMKGMRVDVAYELIDTTARLDKTSIFSAFADIYQFVGASIDWQSEGMLGLGAGYRQYIYPGDSYGGKGSFEARLLLDRKTRDAIGVEYGYLDSDSNAYHQVRAYGRYTPVKGLMLAADTSHYFYDEEINGFDRTHFGDVIAGWEIIPGMRLEGDFGITIDPRFQYALHGMLRFSYEGVAELGGAR